MKKNQIALSILFAIALSCSQQAKTYTQSIDEWHSERISALKKPGSWLSLSGLFWLEPGNNSFGSDSSNQIIFPEDTPAFMGNFTLKDSIIIVSINSGHKVQIDSMPLTEATLQVNSNKTRLMQWETYSWFVIKRKDKIGIRLKNSAHPTRMAFTHIERFPVSEKWRIKARLEKHDSLKTIRVPNVLGYESDNPCPGTLVFEIDGKSYRLDPIATATSKRYWIIFADDTNGETTYGAGRFLYIDAVDDNGETIIDFNKSYNPPCVFSPFATCPLPPLQNRLDVAVTAGEKNWKSDTYNVTH